MSIIRTWRRAYGAGYRAGRAGNSGARCPYTGRWQVFQADAWFEGWRRGMIEQLNTWLKRKKG